MADSILVMFVVVELVMIGVGVAISIRIARMASRPPLGWILLTLAFAVGFIRESYNLAVIVATPTMDTWVSVDQLLTLAITLLILGGVYSMYLGFKAELAKRQSMILAPPEQQ
jgi:hypothetical protein